MSSSESLGPRNRRNSIPSSTGISNIKKPSDKFMKIVMSEMIEDAAQCSFGDVAGQAAAKQALQETVILPSLRSTRHLYITFYHDV